MGATLRVRRGVRCCLLLRRDADDTGWCPALGRCGRSACAGVGVVVVGVGVGVTVVVFGVVVSGRCDVLSAVGAGGDSADAAAATGEQWHTEQQQGREMEVEGRWSKKTEKDEGDGRGSRWEG